MTWFDCKRDGDAAHVYIFGEIGIGQSASDLITQIGDAKTVLLRVDSSGGSASDGMELYELLSTRETTIEIIGRCFSTAVILAMAGRRITATPSARFLIHAPVNFVHGDAAILATESKFLRKLTDRIALAISARTRQPLAVVERWLSTDTYFSASEAKAAGLIDDTLPAPTKANAAPAMAPGGTEAEPGFTDEEQLLLDFLNAIGPLKVASRARLGREIGTWFAGQVRERAR